MNAVTRMSPLLLLCLSGAAMTGDLVVSASTPAVEVSTRPAGRNFMRLPTLRYEFVLTANCPGTLSAQSLSLSIADTRVAVGRDEIGAGSRLEMSVAVPAAQIAPVAVENFCTPDDPEAAQNEPGTLRIPSILSAQAALTCGDEESSEITYASESLDVLLRCEIDESATHSIR